MQTNDKSVSLKKVYAQDLKEGQTVVTRAILIKINSIYAHREKISIENYQRVRMEFDRNDVVSVIDN